MATSAERGARCAGLRISYSCSEEHNKETHASMYGPSSTPASMIALSLFLLVRITGRFPHGNRFFLLRPRRLATHSPSATTGAPTPHTTQRAIRRHNHAKVTVV